MESIYGAAFANAVHLKRIYASNSTLHNASDAFSGCELEFFGYSSTSTFWEISNGKRENCSISAHNIFEQNSLALLDNDGTPQLLVITLSGIPLQGRLLLASYADGQMRSCQEFSIRVDGNSIALLPATPMEGDSLKFFLVDESLRPLQAASTQRLL